MYPTVRRSVRALCSVHSAAMYAFTNHVRRVIKGLQNPVLRVMYCTRVADSWQLDNVVAAPSMTSSHLAAGAVVVVLIVAVVVVVVGVE